MNSKDIIVWTLTLCTSIFSLPDSFGQRFNIHVYSLAEGMPQSQVLSMIQDSRGYMWFGTYGGGLCRFDGLEFQYYTTLNGLPNNSVWCIYEDSKTNLWIGTGEGAAIYNGYSFTVFNNENGFVNSQVNSIIEDIDGSILFATTKGLYRYKNSVFKEIHSLAEESVFTLFLDNNNRIWTGSADSGITIFDKTHLNHFNISNGLTNNSVNNIWQDQDGTIFVCTEKGISTLKKYKIQATIFPEVIQSNNVTSIIKDDDNNYWISTFASGVYKFDGTNYFHITENEGLSSNMIYKCLQDNSGCIWISTDGGGVCEYTDDIFLHYNKSQGLSSDIVMSIIETNDGAMWFGTDGGGLNKLQNNSIVDFTNEMHFSSKRVLSLLEDKNYNIWIGTDGSGIFLYNKKVFKRPFPNLKSNTIHAIHESQDGTLWFGTENGIYSTKDGSLSLIKGDVKGLDETCWTITQDQDAVLWFGTDYGILKYKNGQFVNYNKTDGLSSNAVICLVTDTLGNLWIGTDNGISRFDGKSFIRYNIQDGLASGNIYLMTLDNMGNLILGSDKGLDKITFSGKVIKRIKHYGYKEGFTGIECNANAVCKKKDGNIWFGTIKGVTRFNPKEEHLNKVAPRITINNLQLYYENPDWNVYSDSLTPWNGLPVGLQLPYNKNHLTFSFSASSLKSPDKVRYRFMLEGFDSDWSPVTFKKEVTYSNLPFGNYVFKVLACNEDGVWTKSPTTYKFLIKMPFWRSWWFITLTVVILLLILFGINRLHTLNLRKAKKKLEIKVAQRTQELEEKNIKLENLSIVAQETDQGVLIADQNGRIQWMNNGLEKMTGYSFTEFKEVYGSTIQEISTYSKINEVLQYLKTTGESFQYDSMHITKSGEKHWTTGTITPIINEIGELTKIVSVYTNITEKKKAQDQLKEKNNNIMDSIKYAKKIQEAILPNEEVLYQEMPDSFILYKPRDIVSGDFFWFNKVNDHFVVCAADCTGHGVPGALMSMIGNDLLHSVVREKDITGPHLAMQQLDLRLQKVLHQTGSETEAKDGMDLAMCAINRKNNKMQYAGAHRPILLVRNNEVIQYNASKYSLGGYSRKPKEFKEQVINLNKGDVVYLFSDGYTDQFGGIKGKKFLLKRLNELVLELQNTSMQEQKDILWNKLLEWKGENRQVDDILLMGFRYN